MNITISIHPVYARRIYSGEKKFEFRRSMPKRIDISDLVWMYETSPVRLVTGYFVFCGFFESNIDDMILGTKEFAGVSPEKLVRYYDGIENCQAMIIGRTERIVTPFRPKWSYPPQNFRYGSAWEF